MGKPSAPKPPDLSSTAAASEKNAELAAQLSREQLDWSKEMWAEQKAILDDVMDLQLPMMEEQWKISQEDRQRYEDFYQPLEEEYLARAKEWDTPERRNAEAAKAQTEVASQFDAQRQQALQRLESYGVDPSQTRNAALDVGVRIDQAKAMAQGASNARNQTEREGMGMLGESINVGRGLPSQGLQYAGQSLAAGNAAAGNAAGWQGAANAMGSPQGWMNTSNQGYAQSANIQNAGYQNQLGAWEAKQKNSPLNLVGGLAGAYIGGGMPGMFKDGGEVRALPRYANGGEVDGPGGPRDDAIPARLSDGEYIVPADVVSRKGTEFFDKLVTKTQEDVAAREQNAQATQHALALPPPGALS